MGYVVYVIAQDGTPLMPTERFGKVRWLLKEGRAKVVKKSPFTIQLQYESTMYVQKLPEDMEAAPGTGGDTASSEEDTE